MSKILASEDRHWSLAAAVDALTESARIAGRPSLAWIVGFFYPGVGLGLGLGWSWILRSIESAERDDPGAWILAPSRVGVLGAGGGFSGLLVGTLAVGCAAPLLFPLLVPLFRLIVGLASWAGDARPGERARVRDAWRRGRGITLSCGALWVQCWMLVVAAAATFLLPVLALVSGLELAAAADESRRFPHPIAVLASAPSALIVMVYALAISILFQLALHSLAQNRRGAGSALVHAWRLARRDPWATVRALIGDALLSLLYWIAFWVLAGFWRVPVLGGVALACYIALGGFVGVARALYWARAYRALGGLSPADGVPGLAPER